jgi:hypothetical protein
MGNKNCTKKSHTISLNNHSLPKHIHQYKERTSYSSSFSHMKSKGNQFILC